jgi:hypothetical protein
VDLHDRLGEVAFQGFDQRGPDRGKSPAGHNGSLQNIPLFTIGEAVAPARASQDENRDPEALRETCLCVRLISARTLIHDGLFPGPRFRVLSGWSANRKLTHCLLVIPRMERRLSGGQLS